MRSLGSIPAPSEVWIRQLPHLYIEREVASHTTLSMHQIFASFWCSNNVVRVDFLTAITGHGNKRLLNR